MNNTQNTKKGFLGVFIFYFLIAFEFAYMAGPFAIYFYSVYSPILNFFNKIPALSWLIKFFLPHVTHDTSSVFINSIEVVGLVFAVIGFLIFVVGAIQIYYSKLTKKGAVLGGLYKFIRHPQYCSFIVCSFGLMLLWPRYIVAILFVVMVFVYYFLARYEEIECEQKFGESYIEYEKKTGRFFLKNNLIKLEVRKKEQKSSKLIKPLISFILSLVITLSLATILNTLTINSLYGLYTEKSCTVSICKLEKSEIEKIIDIAKGDSKVSSYLDKYKDDYNLNYILPTTWFAAEIPMNGVVYRQGHKSNNNYDKNLYKIIFTKPTFINNEISDSSKILYKTTNIEPIVEVWVDIEKNTVTDVLDIPSESKYSGIPVAIY